MATVGLLASCGSVDTRQPQSGFILINEREEFAIGDQFAESLARGDRAAGTKPAEFIAVRSGYLADLGRELVSASKRPGVPCEFRVINEGTINAFAVPGHIYVYRGLIELCENESEFASVVGHEIGHVVARHTAKNVSSTMAVSLGEELLLSAIKAGDVTRLAADLIRTGAVKKFGRDEERQADLLGIEECAAAGIDPRGAPALFRKFEKVFKERPNLIDGFFADHPWSGERATNAGKFIAAMTLSPQLRVDRAAFQEWRREVLATAGPAAKPKTAR